MNSALRKIALLRVWYAIFVTIIDTPESDAEDIKKLRKLREVIKREAPELEKELQAQMAKEKKHWS